MNSREDLQRSLHRLIPLAAAMRIEVAELDERSLTLTAPLAANHNHAGSAFAGSLYSLASLAGWAILRELVQRHELAPQLLLGTGNIRYSRPLHAELAAVVSLSATQCETILQRLRSGRSASTELTVFLPDRQSPCAVFSGTYFAKP